MSVREWFRQHVRLGPPKDRNALFLEGMRENIPNALDRRAGEKARAELDSMDEELNARREDAPRRPE